MLPMEPPPSHDWGRFHGMVLTSSVLGVAQPLASVVAATNRRKNNQLRIAPI